MVTNKLYVLLVCRKDVRLPQQLQRAMAAEAEASREARAKVRCVDRKLKVTVLHESTVCKHGKLLVVVYLHFIIQRLLHTHHHSSKDSYLSVFTLSNIFCLHFR